MRGWRLALAALALSSAPALAQDDGGENDNIVRIARNDADMAAAVRQARASLPAFFAKMAAPSDDEHGFTLKFNLTPKADAEFIWADQLRKEGGRWTGVLTDDPLAAGFKIGQRVAIPEADIIDWAYFKGSVAQGHVTTRVLLKQMPQDDANGVRDYLGWPKE